jgi:uncharacterized membrane protein YraQ (UPF0718 family)
MKVNQKRVLLSSVLMLTIAILFWTGSRYPQLNQKALMGADTDSMGISFDMPNTIQFRDSYFSQILSNTLNWIETNKKGMTFGLLFGGILMVLFSLLKDYRSENRWVNTVLGVIIGAPLGVCVNCAAPIAMGMKDAGAKTETALATMISSPTLNVIVISMLFSLLPPYMVWFKIGSTVILLLVVIPLLSRIFKTKEGPTARMKERKFFKFYQLPQFDLQTELITDSSWFGSIKWTIKSFFKGLWYLIKTAVPLMLLAGLLGNVLITFLPLEGFVQVVEGASTIESIFIMIGLALLGTFLPVPMAFDVLITAILWAGGLPAKYSMTLLFTLGSFSIYSAFVVNRSFSRKLALAMFAVVAFIGTINGTIGHFLEKELSIKYLIDSYELLRDSKQPPYFETEIKNPTMLSPEALNKLTSEKTEIASEFWRSNNISVTGTANTPKLMGTDKWFTAIEGQEIGADVPYQFSPLHAQDVFSNQRSMATGDIHRDGYPDILVASANSLFLYANIMGNSFERQSINIPDSLRIQGGALVDMDNDGWLDIFFSTYRDGNYLKFNDRGHFENSQLIKLPQTENLVMSASAAFGDINEDGLLDIVLGNWSLGVLGASAYSVPAAKNYWLQNNGDRSFQLNKLSAPAGETLSTLLSDFMGDGAQDLIVGNDFEMPDYFYEGNALSDSLDLIEEPRNLVEKTTMTTMSVATVDINNDLEYEIYEAQTDQWNINLRTEEISKICGGIKDPDQRGYCEVVFTKQQAYQSTLRHKKFEHCAKDDLLDCIAFQLMRQNTRPDMQGRPKDYFTEAWGEYHFASNFRIDESWDAKQYLESAADNKRPGGVLLMKDELGKYRDKTIQYGLKVTGWAWNSKFADLDNDEWQDLFIANGYLFLSTQESNMFYRNINGKTFEEITVASGLENYLPSSSNSYVDFDLDGDLDIVLATSAGPIYFYKNENHKNQSISFKLDDFQANRFGIGSKVTIYYGEGKHQMRELQASGGYKSYDDPVLHFGLGQFEKVDKVIVKWSTGEETTIDKPLKAGTRYTITRAKSGK